MTSSWDELPVDLEKLDDHLKALLRLKIREFVHLSPWFKELPNADPIMSMSAPSSRPMAPVGGRRAHCPNKKRESVIGRRHARVTLHR